MYKEVQESATLYLSTHLLAPTTCLLPCTLPSQPASLPPHVEHRLVILRDSPSASRPRPERTRRFKDQVLSTDLLTYLYRSVNQSSIIHLLPQIPTFTIPIGSPHLE